MVRANRRDGRDPTVSVAHACRSVPGRRGTLAAFVPKEIEKWRALASVAKIEPQ